MGEAKQRRRLRARLLAENPFCIYCQDKASAVEHMPPKIMFAGKLRPQGLEFACCDPCNRGTKHADLFAAALSRTMKQSGDAESADLESIFSAIANNIPGLLQEMLPTRQQLSRAQVELPDNLRSMNVLSLEGPIASALMKTFTAKLIFALYREVSGRQVPKTGAVAVRWFSSYEHKTGKIPEVLFENPMPRKTLKQGRQEVSDQFEYTFQATPDGDYAQIIATFRYSFLVAGFVAPSLEFFRDTPASPIQPGNLLSLMPVTPSSSSGLR